MGTLDRALALPDRVDDDGNRIRELSNRDLADTTLTRRDWTSENNND